jgi:hypothetical protein
MLQEFEENYGIGRTCRAPSNVYNIQKPVLYIHELAGFLAVPLIDFALSKSKRIHHFQLPVENHLAEAFLERLGKAPGGPLGAGSQGG